jgi:hypothetical protein
MTRLADVYEGDVGRLQSQRRAQLGFGLLVVGALLALASIVCATTDLVIGDAYDARRVAGLFGGLGSSAILGGVVTVLPASPRLRVVAGIGASISLLGIAMFWHAYPDHWAGHGEQLTPYVTGVYFLGTLTLVCCLFAGLVTLKRRNDPGGTVSMEFVTEEQTDTEVVTIERPIGRGGVGRLGGQPDGEVETQTNRSKRSSDGGTDTRTGKVGEHGSTGYSSTDGVTGRTHSRAAGADRGSATGTDHRGSNTGSPASDGGIVDEPIGAPESHRPGVGIDDRGPSNESETLADRYCGNCQYFRYVRTGDGMQPYCGFTNSTMDEMDPCEEWTPNN